MRFAEDEKTMGRPHGYVGDFPTGPSVGGGKENDRLVAASRRRDVTWAPALTQSLT